MKGRERDGGGGGSGGGGGGGDQNKQKEKLKRTKGLRSQVLLTDEISKPQGNF